MLMEKDYVPAFTSAKSTLLLSTSHVVNAFHALPLFQAFPWAVESHFTAIYPHSLTFFVRAVLSVESRTSLNDVIDKEFSWINLLAELVTFEEKTVLA